MSLHPLIRSARNKPPTARYTQGLCAAFALALAARFPSLRVALLYDASGAAFHVVCLDAKRRVIDVTGRKGWQRVQSQLNVLAIEVIQPEILRVAKKDVVIADRYIERSWLKVHFPKGV